MVEFLKNKSPTKQTQVLVTGQDLKSQNYYIVDMGVS